MEENELLWKIQRDMANQVQEWYDDCGDDVVDVQCAERISAEDERYNYRMVQLVH
jgi:hypothetical protein